MAVQWRSRWQRWRAPAPAQLILHLPGQPQRPITLVGGVYRIGRDSGSEIVVEHDAVSRCHALLESQQGRWILKDQGSTNGLWWQGRRIQQLLLSDGDSVRLGPGQLPGLPELAFHRPPPPERMQLRRGSGALLAAAVVGGAALLGLSVLQMPSSWPAACIPKRWAMVKPWIASGANCWWLCNWRRALASVICC